jgi:hypothetical protein
MGNLLKFRISPLTTAPSFWGAVHVPLFLRAHVGLGVLRNRREFQWRGGFRGAVEETRLIGSEQFGLGTVEPTQQLIESLLHAAQRLFSIVEQGEQFADHSLERLGIVGQRSLVRKCIDRDRVGSGVRAHRSYDA